MLSRFMKKMYITTRLMLYLLLLTEDSVDIINYIKIDRQMSRKSGIHIQVDKCVLVDYVIVIEVFG